MNQREGSKMKNMNKDELTAEQGELLEYFMKPRPCSGCNQLIELERDMFDVSSLIRLLESRSLSDAKRAIDAMPMHCPSCWRENHARAEQRWGRSYDLAGSERGGVELSQDEIFTLCLALECSLSAMMEDFKERGNEFYWLVYGVKVPGGGMFVVQIPKFETQPEWLDSLVEKYFRLFWRLQNFLLEAYGEEPMSAAEFFPTKGLREWGEQYERQAGLQV